MRARVSAPMRSGQAIRHHSSGTSRKSAQSWQSSMMRQAGVDDAVGLRAAAVEGEPRERGDRVPLALRRRHAREPRGPRSGRSAAGSGMPVEVADLDAEHPGRREVAVAERDVEMAEIGRELARVGDDASRVAPSSRRRSKPTVPSVDMKSPRTVDVDVERSVRRLVEHDGDLAADRRTAARSACRRAAARSRAARAPGDRSTAGRRTRPSPRTSSRAEVVARVALAEVGEPDPDVVRARPSAATSTSTASSKLRW